MQSTKTNNKQSTPYINMNFLITDFIVVSSEKIILAFQTNPKSKKSIKKLHKTTLIKNI